MWSKNVIKDRVMATLEQRVKVAEAEYVGGCEDIDEKADLAKSDLADSIVNRLIGKFV